MSTLKQCNFEIIDRCNYNCEYCLKSFRKDLVGKINPEYMDYILKLNPEAYIITGGEPSLNKKFIFNFIYKTNKPIILNTNLSNFTIDEIKELNNRVYFHIDFPSIIKDEYLMMTKSSLKLFNRVKSNLKYASNSQIVIVVTDTNKNSIYHSIKVLASQYGFTDFLVSPAISKSISNPIEIFKNLDLFAKNNRNLKINTMCYTKAFELANIKYINVTHRCSAGLDRFIIKANGDIINCAWSNEKVIGKVGDDVKSILLRGRSINRCNRYCLGDILNDSYNIS